MSELKLRLPKRKSQDPHAENRRVRHPAKVPTSYTLLRHETWL